MSNENPPEFKKPGLSTDQKIFFELVEIRQILTRLERAAMPPPAPEPPRRLRLRGKKP